MGQTIQVKRMHLGHKSGANATRVGLMRANPVRKLHTPHVSPGMLSVPFSSETGEDLVSGPLTLPVIMFLTHHASGMRVHD